MVRWILRALATGAMKLKQVESPNSPLTPDGTLRFPHGEASKRYAKIGRAK
jgi:hypothetical protein